MLEPEERAEKSLARRRKGAEREPSSTEAKRGVRGRFILTAGLTDKASRKLGASRKGRHSGSPLENWRCTTFASLKKTVAISLAALAIGAAVVGATAPASAGNYYYGYNGYGYGYGHSYGYHPSYGYNYGYHPSYGYNYGYNNGY